MAGRIPQPFIDELLDRTDIVDVVGDHVQLRKAGKDFQGLCPFHNEKSPSFTVSQAKQFYHCFGCGANGSAIGFLMEYSHLGFVDVVEDLAKRVGMEVPKDANAAPRVNNEPVYSMLDQAYLFYKAQLRQHSYRDRAVNYLKNRGLDGRTAAAFGMGFAPSGNAFLQTLNQDPAKIQLALKAGILGEDEQHRQYDRLRDRIVFPIRDVRGRVIGFGGRIIGDGKPKYLNSPETPVFHKGRELYGLYEARKRTRDLNTILVVEGYMDVVALAQFGITNATATLGTATTSDHLQRLFKSTDTIVFCFDGDNAGRRAAWKALETALPFLLDGRTVRFLFMPEGEDPDSLVRTRGASYFQDSQHTTPLSDYLIETVSQGLDLQSSEGRAQLIAKLSPLIGRLPEGAFKLLLKQEAENLTGLNLDQLQPAPPPAPPVYDAMEPAPPPPPYDQPTPPANFRPVRPNQRARNLAEKTVHLLLTHPEMVTDIEIPERFKQLDIPHISLMYQVYTQIQQHTHASTGQLIEQWRDQPDYAHIQSLVNGVRGMSHDMIRAELDGLLESLQQKLVKQQRKAIVQTADGKISDQFRDLYKP